MVLQGFPLFCSHFGRFRVLKPNSPFVLSGPANAPCYTPKTLPFEGEMSIFDTKTSKHEEKCQKESSSTNFVCLKFPNTVVLNAVAGRRTWKEHKRAPKSAKASTQRSDKAQTLRTRRPPTGVKIHKIGKRGFRGQKTPISQCTRKGRFESKNPIVLVEPCLEMGIFRLKAPFSGALGNGSFLTPKPAFPDFVDFDPHRGSTRSQRKHF